MKTNDVGHGRVKLTRIALGTAELGDLYTEINQSQADRTVARAWDCGIRYFDTAPHYGVGLSEIRVGRALQAYSRDDYVLSTKVGRLLRPNPDGQQERVWDFSASGVRRSLAESMERLGLGRIDIALIHDPSDAGPSDLDRAIQEAAPALAEMRDAGELRAIGVGTRDVTALLRFVRETDVDVLMVAGRMNLVNHSAFQELVPECERRGVSIINAGIFATGLLAQRQPTDADHYEYDSVPVDVLQRARQLAHQLGNVGITLPHAAVQFALAPAVVASAVVGASNPSEVSDAVKWADQEVPVGLWGDLGLPHS